MIRCDRHRLYRGLLEPRAKDCLDCWRTREEYLEKELEKVNFIIQKLNEKSIPFNVLEHIKQSEDYDGLGKS